MRTLAAAVAAVVALAACGQVEPVGPPSDAESAEMMAEALTHLVTEDHTFGAGPPPFTEYLIETHTVPRDIPVDEGLASLQALRESPRPLTEGERSAIEAAISVFGPVRWIEDPDEWRDDDLQPEIEGMAILGVNEPLIDSEGALVPVSLWCGGLCGTWFTYRLEKFDGQWQVTGKEGVIAIS